ncbi:MAG: histidinol-phosphatase HisJ family protein [Ruminococcus sp.]|nr:histidinol-phosphatase HisJ family protein [Ruminococcus sp.]
MLWIDCHTHTQISPDGTGTVAQLCARAASLGLSVLAVTEHVEMNRFFSQAHYDTLPRNKWEVFDNAAILEASMQATTAKKAAAKVQGLTLLCGMEMGQPNADFGLSASAAGDKRLDFIVASLHELLDRPDFFCLDYRTESIPALLEVYFSQLYEICRWGKFDVLGHLTYPLRYIDGEAKIPVDLSPYTEQIRACFRALIENGCGIELNTSGLRQAYQKPFPTLELLTLYRSMGGEILTFGSDAHCAADLGKGIAKGAVLAKAAGFTHACYFVKRVPQFFTLE